MRGKRPFGQGQDNGGHLDNISWCGGVDSTKSELCAVSPVSIGSSTGAIRSMPFYQRRYHVPPHWYISFSHWSGRVIGYQTTFQSSWVDLLHST